jgi:hypothetical protein
VISGENGGFSGKIRGKKGEKGEKFENANIMK